MSWDRLKFRVWDTIRHCFYPNEQGQLCWSLEDTILEEADKDFIREKMIIERCVGVKDKNDKLVFENDILKFSEECAFQIIFDPSILCYKLKEIHHIFSKDDIKVVIPAYASNFKDLEVIGSIHWGINFNGRHMEVQN